MIEDRALTGTQLSVKILTVSLSAALMEIA